MWFIQCHKCNFLLNLLESFLHILNNFLLRVPADTTEDAIQNKQVGHTGRVNEIFLVAMYFKEPSWNLGIR